MVKKNASLDVLFRKLVKLRDSLQEVTDEVETLLASKEAEKTGTTSNKIKLLQAIASKNEPVTKEEFHRMGQADGYADPRGLAGFFKGKKASLNRVYYDGEDRIAVSRYGRQLLEDAGVMP